VFDGGANIGDAFESVNSNWTVGPDTATAGNWVRGNPVGTAAQPEDDTTPGSGVNCWFTGQGTVGGAVGAADVDGGSTVLTSPVYTIENAAPANVRITYNRWFSNNAGAGPNADTFLIEGRIDGGAWQTLELVGPGTTGDPNNSGTWVNASYTLADKGVATGNTLQLRFTARDLDTGSLVEAAIDDLSILAPRCNPPAGCDSIDFNGDGLFPDDADLVDFLAVLAGGACSTGTCNDIDFNNDGLFPDDSDLIAFLRVLAGGNCEP
jgi:aminopeptidase S